MVCKPRAWWPCLRAVLCYLRMILSTDATPSLLDYASPEALSPGEEVPSSSPCSSKPEAAVRSDGAQACPLRWPSVVQEESVGGWELLSPSISTWCLMEPPSPSPWGWGDGSSRLPLLLRSSLCPFLGPVVGSTVFRWAWGLGGSGVMPYPRGAGMACPRAAGVIAAPCGFLVPWPSRWPSSWTPSLLEPPACSWTPGPAVWS